MGLNPTIAFLGLGLMGSGMAMRLVDAGYPLSVYNRNPERAEALKTKGARVAATPREATDGAAFVISMLADDQASRAVWLGPDGALAGAMSGALLIECSTVSVGWIREFGDLAAKKNKLELIDTPVTGSKPQAAAGQLVFLVGGTEGNLERARPVLKVMSKDVIHLGPLGSGAMIKLINNFVCGVQIVALAESIAMIERSGLDFAKALAVLTEGAPGSPLVKVMSARMTARDYTPNFMLKLMAKDLAYAIAEARGQSLELATADVALKRLNQAIDAGFGQRDLSSIVELLRK